MKYIITEDKLKKFLKREFGVDLTGDVEMITSLHQIPSVFDRYFSRSEIVRYMSHYGPMYSVRIDKTGETFLIHDRGGNDLYIYTSLGYRINEEIFFERIGM